MEKLSAIKLHNLAVGYKGVPLLPPFNLEIPKGTINVIVGANGAGKSTLLHTIGGTVPPIGGSVEIMGQSVRSLSYRQLARLVSFVYTDRLRSGGLTVRELIEMGRHPYTGFLGRLSDDDRKITEKAIADVGIEAKMNSFLSDVSDGELQKALIARALAQQTPIILLDEPTNFLDSASRLEILRLIRELVNQSGLTVLFSSHDTSAALNYADNVITLLPHGTPHVSINRTGSSEAAERLTAVFADRGITFNPEINDFTFPDSH